MALLSFSSSSSSSILGLPCYEDEDENDAEYVSVPSQQESGGYWGFPKVILLP